MTVLHRYIFAVRYPDAYCPDFAFDMFAHYKDDPENPIHIREKAERTAAAILGEPVRFDEDTKLALQVAHTLSTYGIRRRMNHGISEVHSILTEEPLTEDEVLAWWKANKDTEQGIAARVRL